MPQGIRSFRSSTLPTSYRRKFHHFGSPFRLAGAPHCGQNIQMDVDVPQPPGQLPLLAPPPVSSSFTIPRPQPPLNLPPPPRSTNSNRPVVPPQAPPQQEQPSSSASAPNLATQQPPVPSHWPTYNLLFPNLPPPRFEGAGSSGEGTSLNTLDAVSAFLAEKGGKPLNTIEYAGVLSLLEQHKKEATRKFTSKSSLWHLRVETTP